MSEAGAHRRDAEGGLWSAATVAAIAVTGFGMLPAWLTGGLAVQIQAELGFGSTGLGVAIASFAAVSAAASIPAGRFVQSRGWRTGALGTLAVIAATMLGVALLAHSWVTLLGLLALAGVGSALSSPAANLGLASTVRAERRGLAFGIKQAAAPGTTLLAGLAVPAIALTVGWRWAFALAALLAVAGVLAVPRRVAHRPAAPRLRYGRAGTRPLVVLALGAGLGTAATNSLGAFLVLSSVDRGVEPQTAGFLLAAGGALSVAARIATGWLADRRGRAHFLAVAAMMGVGAAGLAGLAVEAGRLLLYAATALAFAPGWSWNGLFDFALVRRLPEAPAAATGVAQTGKYIGGVAGPLAFGIAADHLGFAVAWGAAAVVLLAAAGTVLAGRSLLRTALGPSARLPRGSRW